MNEQPAYEFIGRTLTAMRACSKSKSDAALRGCDAEKASLRSNDDSS
jgi:hypothetical protein